MFKCICDYITKTKLERKTQDWKVCFYKQEWSEISYSKGRASSLFWKKIKYSGKYINLGPGDEQKYECLLEGRIAWIDIKELKFPVPGGEDE